MLMYLYLMTKLFFSCIVYAEAKLLQLQRSKYIQKTPVL